MKDISPNDMAQNALMKMATELKKDPSEHIARLMQLSATVLERKLDIVRQQKVWAYEQEKKGSFELLHIKEKLIMDVIMIKADYELYEKPKRKPRQKKLSEKRIEEFQNTSEQTDNSMIADSTDNSDCDKKNNGSEQLTLDL